MMYEDCSKYLKKAKIGLVLLASIPVLGILAKTFSFDTLSFFEIIYVIVAGIFGYIHTEPYITCLSQYKDKKF